MRGRSWFTTSYTTRRDLTPQFLLTLTFSIQEEKKYVACQYVQTVTLDTLAKTCDTCDTRNMPGQGARFRLNDLRHARNRPATR